MNGGRLDLSSLHIAQVLCMLSRLKVQQIHSFSLSEIPPAQIMF